MLQLLMLWSIIMLVSINKPQEEGKGGAGDDEQRTAG